MGFNSGFKGLNRHFMEDGTRGEKVSIVSGYHSNVNEISVLL